MRKRPKREKPNQPKERKMTSPDFFKPPCRRKDLNLAGTLNLAASNIDREQPMNPNKLYSLRRRILCATVITFLLFAGERAALAKTFSVDVGAGGSSIYSPAFVAIQPGDTVKWTFKGLDRSHSVTENFRFDSYLFDSGIRNIGSTFSFTFPNPGTFGYHCVTHGFCCGMIGTVQVGPTPPPPPPPSPTPCPSATPRPASQAQLLNISTRMDVQTGEHGLIGGFIVTGNFAKRVMLRAIGPSLTQFSIVGALADPVLELHAADGSLITSNDNWKEMQQSEIEAAGFAPQDDLESAIIATLDPGLYTAIVSDKNGASGVGLVEGYDVDQAADAQVANFSTRGFVEAGSNVMIGGVILGNGSGTTNILVRALGPSLSQVGVSDTLADPTLELHDANGAIVMSNDNWKDTQECELEGTGIAPSNDLESAMVVTISTGAYTAIVTGNNNGTGVALVEVYRLP